MSNYYVQGYWDFRHWPDEAVSALGNVFNIMTRMADWQEQDAEAEVAELRHAKISKALGEGYSWAEKAVQEILQELYSDDASLPSPDIYADQWYFEEDDGTLLAPLFQSIECHFAIPDNKAAQHTSAGSDSKRVDGHYITCVYTARDSFLVDYNSNYSAARSTALLEHVILPAARNTAIKKDDTWWKTVGDFMDAWRQDNHPMSSCSDYPLRQEIMQLLFETEKNNLALLDVRSHFLLQQTWKISK